MSAQPEQLKLDMSIPGQFASFIQLEEVQGDRYTHEVSRTVHIAPPVVEYLASASLRSVLHEQMQATDPNWALVVIVGDDGEPKSVSRVPRRSIADRLSFVSKQ